MKQVTYLLLLLLVIILTGCAMPERWQSSREYADYIISELPISNGISQKPEVLSEATHKVVADFSPNGEWWLTAYLVDFDICCSGMLLLRDFYIEADWHSNSSRGSEIVYVHVLGEYYLSNYYDIIPIGRGQ